MAVLFHQSLLNNHPVWASPFLRARTVHSKQSEEDEEDAWSVDEGIHVEEDEQGTASVVDNSEWEDLVNKTVDFVFD